MNHFVRHPRGASKTRESLRVGETWQSLPAPIPSLAPSAGGNSEICKPIPGFVDWSPVGARGRQRFDFDTGRPA